MQGLSLSEFALLSHAIAYNIPVSMRNRDKYMSNEIGYNRQFISDLCASLSFQFDFFFCLFSHFWRCTVTHILLRSVFCLKTLCTGYEHIEINVPLTDTVIILKEATRVNG